MVESIMDATRKRLKKFVQAARPKIRRYAIVSLALVVTALILITVIFIRPSIEKGAGWLGVKARQDPARGALVISDVVAGSPAYDVGMLKGDAILSYEGIAVADINTLKLLIRDSYINEVVRIILERNGVRLVANTRIAKRPGHANVLPPILSIAQGTPPPHEDRGLCVDCHTIVPPKKK
jgi:predicted metalloprotease with PDZ domain